MAGLFRGCRRAVTVAVEYVFRRVHPMTELTQALEGRLQAVEDVLRQIAADLPLGEKLEKQIVPVFSARNLRDAKTVAALRFSAADDRANERGHGSAGTFDRSYRELYVVRSSQPIG